ncbi:MAG TPA: pseudaminic acid biosynthesis-associated methylase [bacterium]|nr:pseudaminic acid biosynthesis-associated methylase [bacterium]
MSDKQYSTDQESFWATDFGNEYIIRNSSEDYIAPKMRFLSCAISKCRKIDSVIEFGSNIGLNMIALRPLLPKAKLSAVEINPVAYEKVKSLGFVETFNESILEFKSDRKWDLVFTKGVLIHINPDRLPDVYDRMFSASREYVLMCEYYNPTPMEIEYRGHRERLFKRDFAGEFMDRHKGVELVDYGFIYYRDPIFPLGDFTWFLMRKPQ